MAAAVAGVPVTSANPYVATIDNHCRTPSLLSITNSYSTCSGASAIAAASHSTGRGAGAISVGVGDRKRWRKSTGTSDTSVVPCQWMRATPSSAVAEEARRSAGNVAVSSLRCWVIGWIVASSWA